MYRHLSFIMKVCENVEYWRDTDVITESIKRYQKFMMLKRKYSGKLLVPTLDIELVWRAHQTQPHTYVRWALAFIVSY